MSLLLSATSSSIVGYMPDRTEVPNMVVRLRWVQSTCVELIGEAVGPAPLDTLDECLFVMVIGDGRRVGGVQSADGYCIGRHIND